MSEYRDSLPEGERAAYDEAVANAGQILADARAEQAALYQQGGAEAVARAAYVPGGPSVEQLAERYEQWVRELAAQLDDLAESKAP